MIVAAASMLACGDDATSGDDTVEPTTGIDDADVSTSDGDPIETTGDAETGTDVPPGDGGDLADVDDDDGTIDLDADAATGDATVDLDVAACPALPALPCEVSNAFGTCSSAWQCVDSAWVCAAATPSIEVCDGVDNDCNDATDEGFKDPVSGLYDRDDACGSCTNDCTAGLGANAYGRCDVSAAPTCELVCCTSDDPHPSCDGRDWSDVNGQAGDGCEAPIVQSCAGEGDCPPRERCIDQVCVPNAAGGPCESDADCAVGDACYGGICGCAGDTFTADAVPPNVLIVIDRSSSMTQVIGDDEQTKWEIAKEAVASLTTTFDSQVRFGLKLFPGIDQAGTRGDDACGPGVVWVDTGPNNASAINDFLEDAGTSSGTPIAEALRPLVDYDGLEDTLRNNYVILITDGQASCDAPVTAVEALLAETPTIRTFIIGFGDGVDPDELNALADAGDTALPGDTRYYQADDPLSLGEALTAIAGNVLGCSYALGGVPPDTEGLGVYFDTVAQPLDPSHTNGWDYSPMTNQVTFYGGACDTLLDGAVDDLAFVYGCPGPIIIGGD